MYIIILLGPSELAPQQLPAVVDIVVIGEQEALFQWNNFKWLIPMLFTKMLMAV
jgi:hypothetical protein